jgi:hypothetical protein
VAAPPKPVPEGKSNLLWWVLGLLVAGTALLGLGIFLASKFLVNQIEVTQSGAEVEVRTPAGDLRVAKEESADLGLPVYPEAKLVDSPATVELTPPDAEPVYITTARYRTNDSPAAVDAWYQEQLGREFEREGPGVMILKREVFGVEIQSDDTLFLAKEDLQMRAVVIQKRGFLTEIALLRIGKPAPL